MMRYIDRPTVVLTQGGTTTMATVTVILRTILRNRLSYDQWRIQLEGAHGSPSLAVETVPVGDTRRWEHWCEVTQLPRHEEKLAA